MILPSRIPKPGWAVYQPVDLSAAGFPEQCPALAWDYTRYVVLLAFEEEGSLQCGVWPTRQANRMRPRSDGPYSVWHQIRSAKKK